MSIHDVLSFHRKFHLPVAEKPVLLNMELMNYRLAFLHEELKELEDAWVEGNLNDCMDALLDLEYVIHGTAIMMGLHNPYKVGAKVMGTIYLEGMRRVHAANMAKVPIRNISESKRHSPYDVKKPEGWQAPDFKDLLQ